MPNIKSSERSVKTDALRRGQNFAVKSATKTVTRKVNDAIAAGKENEAKNLLVDAISTMDKAVAKGVLHKNAAARKKSNLVRKINAMNQQ